MKKLLPILLVLVGIGGGVGAGLALRPAPDMSDKDWDAAASQHADEAEAETPLEETREYVKLNNQFVVPVIEGDKVKSLVVMSLSVEVLQGQVQTVFSREPKLRDSFLQVLFDHANVGGFRGAFTDNNTLDVLRASLRDVAIRDGGDHVTDVLILEIARQDY